MGIRFSCHGCAKPLNIKNDLAGRRGVCPECKVRFRIPLSDAEFSTPVDDRPSMSEDQLSPGGAIEGEHRSATQEASTGTGHGRAVEVGDPYSAKDAGGNQATMETHAGVKITTQTESVKKSASASTAQPDTSRPAIVSGDEFEPLGSDPAATWYVRPPSGGQYGPADADVLKGWIAEGRVAKTALIWRDGWPQWREAAEAFPEISDALPGGSSSESIAPFSETSGGPKLTAPASPEKSSRVVSSDLSGDARIGAARRKRSSRRVTLVAVLATLVVGLIATLIIVASTRG